MFRAMGEMVNGLDPRINALTLDVASGFLVSGMESEGNTGVTVASKLKFLEVYRSTGNFEESARLTGVNARTMRYHIRADEKFREEFEEAREALCDQAEGFIVQHMARPSNVIDRLSFLRAYRPKVWNIGANQPPSVQVQINNIDNARHIVDSQRLNTVDSTVTPTGVQGAVRPDGQSNTIDTKVKEISSPPEGFYPMRGSLASACPVQNSEKIKRPNAPAYEIDPNHLPPKSNRTRRDDIAEDQP